MLSLLAQTAPETLPARVAAYDWSLWVPTSHNLLNGSMALGAGVIVGLFLMWALRDRLLRVKLGPAVAVGILASAVYVAVWAMKPERMRVADDLAGWWVTRIYISFMLFVMLRVVDRLALVPLLTRRGTVAIPRVIHQIVNIVLAVFVILIFGSLAFGWDIDKFLAGSAVVSIVLGLALQESLGNFFSGLVMQASPPFAIGDWIVCGDHEGRVVDMTWRAVTIHTNDDNFIVVPNGTMAKADIVNFNAPTVATARTIKVGLESDVVPTTAISILKTAALETAGVQATPEPFVYLEEYADAAVVYAVKFWIMEPSKHRKIEHQVRVHAWYRLREQGIPIPNPTFNIEHVAQHRKAARLQEAAGARFVAAIDHVAVLQPLSAGQKRELAASANDVMLAAGQVLFRQGDAGESFYIISKGQVEVLVKPEGSTEERQVAVLGPGDFFGEMSALTGQPRTATIRAMSSLLLVQIEKRDLLGIFQADPGIMERISEVVARRNAEREAVLKGPGAIVTREAVVERQKTLLGRMMGFFRLGNAA